MKLADFQTKKTQQHKISMLTCYDYPSACAIAKSNIDCILVGDSVAMTVHGHKSTLLATMEMMELHTSAVARGIGQQFLISDLPFLSYRESLAKTIHNVKILMRAGAMAVKLEGGDDDVCHTIQHLVHSGIPVMGHLGLTPQSFRKLGGYKVQGRDELQAELIIQQAKNLQQAGCFAIVLECIPGQLAKRITAELDIATIGIGAGRYTDGQVLVWHDVLGLEEECKLKFVKNYTKIQANIVTAINAYASDVTEAKFPSSEHTFV